MRSIPRLLFLSFLAATPLFAATVTWDGTGDGTGWDDPANWDTDALPTAADDVVIDDPTDTLWITNTTDHITIRSLQSDASLVIEAGNVTLTGGVSEVRGDFILTPRKTLSVKGAGTTLTTSGGVQMDGVSVSVEAGATITLAGLTSYLDNSGCCGSRLRVHGVGSVLSLPDLVELTGNPTWAMNLQAIAGGVVQLPQLASVPDSQLRCYADGAGSLVDLPLLADIHQPRNGWLTLDARNGGTVNSPLITDGRRVSIYLRNGGSVPLDQFTGFTLGNLDIGNGYDLSLPTVSTLDGAEIKVSEGATLVLPGVVTYADASGCCGAVWQAHGVDSVLSLPNLVELTGNPTWAMRIEAVAGGVVQMPQLASVPDSQLRCYAEGADSLVDLPLLADIHQPRNGWLTLDARNGGTVNSPLITDGRRVSIYLRNGGSVPLDQFTGFTLGKLDVGNGYDLSLPGVSTLDGAEIKVSEGATLVLPGVVTYADTSGCCGAVWQAHGVDSVLSLPNLVELTGNPTWAMDVQAIAGGEVRLPQLASVPNSQLRCYAEGAGSLVDVPVLADLNQPRSGWLTLDARNEGAVHSPLITDGRRVSIYLRNGGSVPLDQFTSFILGSLDLGGGYAVNLPNVTALDGVKLVAADGARIELPGVTTFFDSSGCCGTLWTAQGAGSLISIPNLVELTGNPNWAMTIQGTGGGVVELPGVRAIPGSWLRVYASGTDSLVDLSELAGFGGGGRLTLEADTGGSITVNGIYCALPGTRLMLGAESWIEGGLIELGPGEFASVSGEIRASLINHSSFRPGSSPGQATIIGDFEQAPDGRLVIEVAGTEPGTEMDRLVVAGNATLDGILEAKAIDGFVASPEQVFSVLTATEVTGRFATLADLAAGPSLEFSPVYAPDRVDLTVGFSTGPRVTEVSPTGTVQTLLNEFIVRFSELVDPASFTEADIELTGPAGTITVSPPISLHDGRWRIRFPEQRTEGDYTLRLGTDVTDYAGNPMNQDADELNGEPEDAFETTVFLDDDEGPLVAAFAPLGAVATDVTRLTLTFTEPVDPATFSVADLSLITPGGPIDSGLFTLASNDGITHTVTLPALTVEGLYTVQVGPDFADLAGTPMPEVFTAQFTIDKTAPRVVAIAPSGEVTEALRYLDVIFDEPILATSFTKDDVSFTGPDGAIPITSIELRAGNTHRLHFASQGVSGDYTLLVGPNLTDLAGNRLNQDGDAIFGEATQDRFETTLIVRAPDLVVLDVTAPASALPGETIPVSWTVKNAGNADVTRGFTEVSGLTLEALVGVETRLATFSVPGPLPAGGEIPRTQQVTLPLTGPAGPLLLIVTTDSNQQIGESDEANNSGFSAATIDVPLTLSLQTSKDAVAEGGAVSAKVLRNGPTTAALAVSLASGDASELAVPAEVLIPAGRSEVSFTLNALTDGTPDGPQTTEVEATAAGFRPGRRSVTVTDVNVARLTVALADPVIEEGQSTTGTLTREGGLAAALTVSLGTSSPGQVSLPAEVTIPAGEASAPFEVLAVDDQYVENTRGYTLTADAAGFERSSAIVTVTDNDAPGLSATLQPTRVFEGAGPNAATLTLSRTADSVYPVRVRITALQTGLLLFEEQILFNPGEFVHHVPITPIDDDAIEDNQTVTLIAQPLETLALNPLGGGAAVELTILDDDGPGLHLRFVRDWVCGDTENYDNLTRTSATLTRTGDASAAAVVTLTADEPGWLDFPATAGFDAGSTQTWFTVSATSPRPPTPGQSVTFTAMAEGYHDGVATLWRSSDCRPDLRIVNLEVPAAGLTDEYFSISYRDQNFGTEFAIGELLTTLAQRVLLSTDPAVGDDEVLGRVVFDGTVDPYEFLDRSATFRLPSVPGDYWVIVQADAGDHVRESSEFNNDTVSAAPIHVDPAYTATVEAEVDVALAGTPVPLSGTATKWGTTEPAPFELVSLHIGLRDTVRTVAALTDEAGHFSVTFTPLPGEAGTYTVAAAHPGMSSPPVQDTFTLLGMRANPAALERTITALTTVDEVVTLENLGDVPLTGLAVEVIGLPAEFTVEAAVDEALAPFGQGTLTLRLGATQDVNVTRTFTVGVSSDEGALANVILTLTSESLRPRLEAGPALLAGVVPGTQRFLEFTVTNHGGSASGPLNVLLPPVPFLRVLSPSPLASLPPGGSTVVSLQLAPSPDAVFAEYRGNLVVSDGAVSASVPYTFRVVSDQTGTLIVEVTDQFTYYAEGAPRVVGARVTLKDPYNGALLHSGESSPAGLVAFPEIPEGWYDLEVTADEHSPFRQTVFVTAGDTAQVEALMAAQTVQFFWSVVPVQLEDRTRITIEAVFETVVPVPVVTVEPSVIDMADHPAGGVVNMTVTNHGLLAAQNVRMFFSGFDCYRFTPLISDLGTLAAKSSMVVPVRICFDPTCLGDFDRCDQMGARALLGVGDREVASAFKQVRGGGGGGSCGGGVVTYSVPCGNGGVNGSAPIGVTNAGGNGCGGFGQGGGGGGSGGGSVVISGGGGPSDCNPCGLEMLGKIAKCLWDLVNPLPDLVKCLQGLNDCYNEPNPAGCISAGLDCLSALGKEVPYLGTAITLYCCAESLSYACGGDGLGVPPICGNGPGGGGGPGPLGAVASDRSVGLTGAAAFANPLGFDAYPGMAEVAVAALHVRAVLDVFAEIFGGPQWLTAMQNASFQPWFELLATTVAAGSEEGELISASEEAILRGHPFKLDFNENQIARFIERWNRTLDYYAAGTFDSTDLPPGEPVEFIAKDLLLAQVALAETAQQEAESAGFATPFEELDAKIQQLRAFLYQPSSGICAQVRLRIDQEAVIARDAFRATLEVVNGAETPLTEVSVEITVANEAGEVVTPQFLIPDPSLTRMGAIDGTGEVAAGTTGVAEWNILPTTDTAITGPTLYFVSGSIRYRQNGALTTVPLAPSAITVYPLAQLHLTYFHERNVLADDPFTDEVEPSVPYSLAVMVKNAGLGEARNVRITSAQPVIIENEKGLFVDFQIIATEVNGQNLVPSLTAAFGDIAPGDIGIGRWLLKSTLQGLFVEYSAEFEHLDGLGEKRASIIQSVEIKELIRLVNLEGGFDDGRPDMLVNDFPDIEDLPDALYLSDGSIEPVAIETTGTASGGISPANLQTTLTATPRTGWTYLRVPDPGNGRYRLVEVRRPDGRTLGVGNTAWTTDRTFIGGGKRPIKENNLHLLDHDSLGRYTLTYEPVAEPDLQAPTSAIAALPASSFPQIPLSWSGADTGGSGLATFDVYVSDNGGPFNLWLERTALSGAVFSGEFGHTYAFYSVATDQAGNRETAPANADATTTADRENTAPVLTVGMDVTVDEGQTVRITNTATDAESDVQTLAFSLGAGTPPGVTINPQTGLITWPTGEGTGPGVHDLTVMVRDNGVPPLSDSGVVHVTVREVNSTPHVIPVAPERVNEGELLSVQMSATDLDLPANQLTFSLGPNAPAGTAIDPVSGLFTWTPGALQGPSTNDIPVLVTDDGIPPLTGQTMLTVVVRDRLGDFLLEIGRTNVLSGNSAFVPVRLTSDSLSRLDFTLEVPAGWLDNLAIEAVAPDLLASSLTPLGGGAFAGRFEFDPAGLVNGEREVARLRFDVPGDAPSAVLPLRATEVTGLTTGDELLTNAKVGQGRVIVVLEAPVLDACCPDTPQLILYGQPGGTYEIEVSPAVGPNAAWTVVDTILLEGEFMIITDVSLPDTDLFYRARTTTQP